MRRVTRKWALVMGGVLVTFWIGVFFKIGNDRKNDSYQGHCLSNQQALFVAAKVYMKENNLQMGDPLDRAEVLRIAAKTEIECWSGGDYTWRSDLPNFDTGECPVSCSHKDHQPKEPISW